MEILAFLEVAVEHEAPCSRQCLGQNRPSPLWGWCLKLNRPNCLGAIALLVLTINLLGHVLGAAIAQAGILAPGQILRRGNQSSLVRELQQRLRDRRFFNERVTGFYGPVTEDAVRRYQQSVGLPADGIYGPATDDRLFGVSNPQRGGATGGATQLGSRVLSNGDQGSDVSDLQQLLNERVGFTSIDGDFGDATERRVRQVQQFSRLTVDGRVGSETLSALRRLPPGQIAVTSNSGTEGVSNNLSWEARRATENAASINRGNYTVVIPTDSDNRNQLAIARRVQPLACMARSRRGSYIFAGGYPTFSSAETVRLRLRAERQSPNTSRLDARIDYRRDDDFRVECLF